MVFIFINYKWLAQKGNMKLKVSDFEGKIIESSVEE